MTDNDRIDEKIRSAAADYNSPPATPREEMWTAIQAAGAAAPAPRLHVAAGGASKTAPLAGYSARGMSQPKYAWFGLAAAAVLLVATGVGIGRWTSESPTEERRIADAPAMTAPVVRGDGIVTPENRDTQPSASDVPPAAAPSGSRQAQPQRGATTRTRDEIRRNPVVIGQGGVTRLATGPASGRNAGSSSNPDGGSLQAVSYQVATQQHLQDAEALLTSFSLESRDEKMNSQFAGWAKGLLSNTRLLLDSPAGDDPRRAKLLQDLELVLAQIVQLSPNAAATDRELIQGSIQNGLVMTRLRSAIPADQPREITER